MKKYPHGLTLIAVCAAIEDYQRHEDSLPEEGILAAFNTLLGHSDIADELRIKQNHIRLRDTYIEELEQRAEAAEARLAETEKQEPRYQIQKKPSYGRESVWIDVASREEAETNVLHGYRWRMVYDCPAPAVSLAELVPEGWRLVPVEPSWEMISAAIKTHEGDAFLPVSLYKTMLAAAPEVE